MALTVDTTKRYRNIPDGQNFTFSLSKPLNQLTASDLLTANCWVGFNCCSINQVYEGKGGEGIPENNPNYCNLWGTSPDWWYDQTNWASVHWSFPANQPNGIYMRNVYINRDLNAGNYTNANSTARIVLEITPDANTTIQKLCMIGNSNYLQAEYNTSSYDNQISDYTYISPAVLLVVNNCAYLINQNVQRFFVPDNIGFHIDSTTDQGYSSYFPSFENLNYHKLSMGWTMAYNTGSIEDNCVKTGTGSAPIYTYNDVDFNGHTGILQLTGGGTNYHIRIGCTMSANADDSDFSLIHRAYTGVRFKVNDTWYKPIIEGGIVTGYTDDFTKKSEWDGWTKATGHNVPTGGGGSDGEVKDKTTKMQTGYISGTAGMVNYIEINRSGLASADDISNALSRFDITTIGKDLLRNLISFKCFALLNIGDSVARQIKIGGYALTDENEQALQGEYIGGLEPIDINEIYIPKLYNDYRDYAPYTSIQMYVPFCGWFDLPSWCIGKTITGDVYTDLYNGTVKAVIFAHDAYTQPTVVAEVGGCCAFDIPFVAEATGMKASAVISSALTTAAATGANIATPNIATGIAAVSSAANLISAVNMNTTTLKGVLGDGSNLNGLLHVYIKVSRPQSPTHNTGRPDAYKHEYGIPTFKEITLKAGDGFVQVSDAKVTGTMTAAEKQMIIDGFRHGLIL